MKTIEVILKSGMKPKERIVRLADSVKKGLIPISAVIDYYEKGSTAEKGDCIEAMEFVSEEKPEMISTRLDFVIGQLNHAAPRVKWESARILGNAARNDSDRLGKAIPKLLANAKDEGTVVRWSAARALTELAIRNSGHRKKLLPQFKRLLKSENNNGVKKIYLKAVSLLENDSKKAVSPKNPRVK
jgi:hypothetical protein